ncbi:beta family protein [Pedobacter miscanthi]|uniref:beta family protein n=1 Tax=Pedobacter miscanthi TaxID=2259170 RepID=UPI0029319E83|nr:hypothetical protein [Pedobacter miscanthi]
MEFKYFPVLRARQQEIDVLQKFDFGEQMVPLIEIIKEKDRKDNQRTPLEIYSDIILKVKAKKVLIDLPIYITPKVSTSAEVRTFFLSTISRLDERIAFYAQFSALADKLIPVISILEPISEDRETLIKQYESLSGIFPQIAFRIYNERFDAAFSQMQDLALRDDDLIIYDLEKNNITSPIVVKHRKFLDAIFKDKFQIVIRSAINTEIQNVNLEHGEVIGQADNSLKDLFALPQYHFNAFGDYAGVKRDDLNAGGGISPGLVFFNPDENLYYGYRGPTKNLAEFETTIIPAVLDSGYVKEWVTNGSPYVIDNLGYDRLLNIGSGNEPSKNQAKYKWISIMHYLHSIKMLINAGAF